MFCVCLWIFRYRYLVFPSISEQQAATMLPKRVTCSVCTINEVHKIPARKCSLYFPILILFFFSPFFFGTIKDRMFGSKLGFLNEFMFSQNSALKPATLIVVSYGFQRSGFSTNYAAFAMHNIYLNFQHTKRVFI